jgi:hypothetical protein
MEPRHDQLSPLERLLLRALYEEGCVFVGASPHDVAADLAGAGYSKADIAQVRDLLEQERADRA